MGLCFFLIIIGFVLFTEKDNILFLFAALIPFHTFLKSIFIFYSSYGEIFSYWKETTIVILIFKILKSQRLKIPPVLGGIIVVYFFWIFFYFSTSPVLDTAFPTLRDHIFSVLILLCAASIETNKIFLRKLVMVFTIAVFINCIMGFVENFFMHIPIGTMMGTIDFIDAAGFIQYKTTSFRIMGFQRMSGILGGPNAFGVYTALCTVFLSSTLLSSDEMRIKRLQKIFLVSTLCLTTICLVFTFSRAGWVICVLGHFILLKVCRVKITVKHYVIAFFTVSLLFLFVSINFPYVGDVIGKSLAGKEDSAADRGNNFSVALDYNLSHPWGHGLGTTDNRTKNKEFFAESAFMNIFYEIGVLGLLILFSLFACLIKKIGQINVSDMTSIAKTGFAVTIPSFFVCFVSVNPYEMPFIYLWWLILGLSINPCISRQMQLLKTVIYHKIAS
jgi:O-antigen ligase